MEVSDQGSTITQSTAKSNGTVQEESKSHS